jgi:ABC-type branched-subunit amino acid transport system substrate-binding protein
VQPRDVPDALELVSSTPLGVELAVEQAVARGHLPSGSGIVVLELTGEIEADVERAAALAGDPTVVAAFLTPFTDAPAAVEALADAGVPVVSLSGIGQSLAGPGWLRVVPSIDHDAETLAAVARVPSCVAGATAATMALAETLANAREAPRTLPHDPSDTADRAAECADVIWLGDADGAVMLRRALDAGGRSDVGLVVSLAARSERLAREGYPAAVGTRAVVPCFPLLTSAEPDAQRFIHAYQASHGVPPGPCAAEAYTAARRLLGDQGKVPTRQEVIATMAALRRLGTPAGPIVVGPAGERAAPEPSVEQVVGVRWLPEEPAGGPV